MLLCRRQDLIGEYSHNEVNDSYQLPVKQQWIWKCQAAEKEVVTNVIASALYRDRTDLIPIFQPFLTLPVAYNCIPDPLT
mgnify:CR=1 FL=1